MKLLSIATAAAFLITVEAAPRKVSSPPTPVNPVGSPLLQLKDSWHLSTQADYLYWNSNETALPYAMKALVTHQIPSESAPLTLVPQKEYYIPTDQWNSGFRVGVGIDFPYDGWSLFAQYTYYRNRAKASQRVPDFSSPPKQTGIQVLMDPWSNPADNILSTDTISYNQCIEGHWNQSLDLVDFTLSRPFWLSKSFALSPFAGIRLAWYNTTLRSKAAYKIISTATTNLTNKAKFTNNYFGAGIVAGIEPLFYINRHLFIFNTLDVAILYGHLESKRKAHFTDATLTYNVPSNAKTSLNSVQPIVDLNLGLGWGSNTSNDRLYYEFRIGYESHLWFNASNRTKLLARNANVDIPPAVLFSFSDFLNTSTYLLFQGVFASFDLHY